MLTSYLTLMHAAEENGRPCPKLDVIQTQELIALLMNPPAFEEPALYELLRDRVESAPSEASQIKRSFLEAVVDEKIFCPLIGKDCASDLLAEMNK
ncbi:hypothetical protein [Pseudomonas nitroreducens]|uniref:Aconitase B HEAT-like domain-containing protein n=1 Tax=Pseudomonas nitroreducens TaxID=46680 RepID=A0A6G6J5T8_PSENT|nr:hypothetical protein [Pseudomonas nitroreducens]QIE89841.1 hypothetical protein G5B91_27700 [Pseudomonas nitroreducens]